MLLSIFLPTLIKNVFSAKDIVNCNIYNGDICAECYSYSNDRYGVDTDKNSETYGLCIKCKIAKCYDCKTNAYICEECIHPYKLDTDPNSKTYGKCISCPHHCDSCNIDELDKCESCYDYSIIDDKKECAVRPESKLPNCNLDHDGKCFNCKKGYGPDDDGKCIPCVDKGCSDCDYNAHICNNCFQDYYYYNYTSSKCEECGDKFPNCKKCSKVLCEKCNDGYILYSSHCYSTKCIEHCELCHNETNCYKCESGYGLNSTGSCVPCSKGTCADCGLKYTDCARCKINYTMGFNGCEYYENPHCSESMLTICRACEEGYSLDTTTTSRTCVKSVIPNCELYHGDKCYWCLYPYLLDEDTNECKRECKEFCTCSRRTTCEGCIDGYQLNGTKCIPIGIEGCYKLNSEGVCTSCIGGYYYKISEKKCTKCADDNCINCEGGIDLCTECKNGYGLDLSRGSSNFGKCHRCTVKNCIKCDNYADHCQDCQNNYELYLNKCNKIYNSGDDDDGDGNGNDGDGDGDGNDGDGNNGNGNNSSGNNKNKLPIGAIIGIVVGCVVVVGLVIFLLVFFLVIKKKKADHSTSEAQEK